MMKKQFLFFLFMLLPMMVSAESVEINGLWYNLITKTNYAEVVKKPSGSYSGVIIIPEIITYNEVDYTVTKIGDEAFNWCDGITSITIPPSITSIGEKAFFNCYGLTSVHISDLAAWCNIHFEFYANPIRYAHHLYLNDTEIKDLVIPSGVTHISISAFQGCSGFNSISIPNSVVSIGEAAFDSCSGLTSVTIPNSVTDLGNGAFCKCSGLTSVTLPNSISTINAETFYECTSLSSFTIPNNITSIGGFAFYECTGLKSINIPNSVTSIGLQAFSGCRAMNTAIIGNSIKKIDSKAFANCVELSDVYCSAISVPSTKTDAFSGSYIESATLHVPTSSVDMYKELSPWKKFKEIVKIDMPKHSLTYIVDGEVYKTYQVEEGELISPEPAPTKEGYTFLGWSEIPSTMPAHDVTITGSFIKDQTQKCATPIISVVGGKIKLSCDTENVKFKTTVTYKSDSKDIEDEEIILSSNVVCNLSVYATKEGYKDSDVATKEITLRLSAAGDANADGEVDIADAVQIVNFIVGKVNALSRIRDVKNPEPE